MWICSWWRRNVCVADGRYDFDNGTSFGRSVDVCGNGTFIDRSVDDCDKWTSIDWSVDVFFSRLKNVVKLNVFVSSTVFDVLGTDEKIEIFFKESLCSWCDTFV